MDPDKNKIQPPFSTPDGYFENFETRLAQRMSGPAKGEPVLQVMHRRRGIRIEWVAAAAAAIAIVITAWFLFRPQSQPENTVVRIPVQKTDTLPKPRQATDSAKLADHEIAVVQEILEVAESGQTGTEISTVPVAPEAADLALARELEDAGLIVLDTGDGLFDESDIQP